MKQNLEHEELDSDAPSGEGRGVNPADSIGATTWHVPKELKINPSALRGADIADRASRSAPSFTIKYLN